jgi:hypothetical protein
LQVNKERNGCRAHSLFGVLGSKDLNVMYPGFMMEQIMFQVVMGQSKSARAVALGPYRTFTSSLGDDSIKTFGVWVGHSSWDHLEKVFKVGLLFALLT